MKLTITNKVIWDFCQMQGYLNTISKVTQLPLINLERDCMYAFTRTGKKLKDDIEILQEEQKRRVELLKPISEEKDNNYVPLEGKKAEFDAIVEQWSKDWDALLEKEIEVEIHQCQLSDVPKGLNLPEVFWRVLEVLIFDPEPKK